MRYFESVERYVNDLAAKIHAPGGGSASALVGAIGVACLEMVANFTVDKKGYEQHQEEIKIILNRLENLRKALLGLMDEDVEVYTHLNQAYKLPKNTPEEQRSRSEEIQKALRFALSIPENILKISNLALEIAERLLHIGNKNLISDVFCGAEFLRAAVLGAKANVEINLNGIVDKAFVVMKKKNVEEIIESANTTYKRIIEK